MSEKVNWDAIENELEMAMPQAIEKVVEIFDHIDWGWIGPGGMNTMARAQMNFPDHPRIDELQGLIKEITMDTLRETVEAQS